MLGTSAAILAPCFWHSRIEAGDLGSHIYNAWLAHLIAHGQAPGLYLARQWNNVLVDVALTRLGGALGFGIAEKIVISCAVLIFFWGAFALVAAATQRVPWFLAPGVAMVAYGWTFQTGFMNYYVSLGLAFLAIALLWRGRAADHWLALALGAFVFLAHPMGSMWLVGAAAYCKLSESVPVRLRWPLFLAGLLAVGAGHSYVFHHYRTFAPVNWRFFLYAGPDQLVVYGHRYRVLAGVVLLITAASIVLDIARGQRASEFWRRARTLLELWAIAIFSTAMLCESMHVPRYALGVAFLPQRLSLITAVLGLCILGCVDLRKWHFIALASCAAVFFAWTYQDTGVLNGMEQQAETLVQSLPAGRRVIQTVVPFPGWRIVALHVVDRACLGRCYAYSNYEPSSQQFRVRVMPNSPVVVDRADSALAMREGRYVVRPEDLPLTEIYQCDDRHLSSLCMRDLVAGERNGRVGYQSPWVQQADH